jgi:hypothetical protein
LKKKEEYMFSIFCVLLILFRSSHKHALWRLRRWPATTRLVVRLGLGQRRGHLLRQQRVVSSSAAANLKIQIL